jgi:hypothetical protein
VDTRRPPRALRRRHRTRRRGAAHGK